MLESVVCKRTSELPYDMKEDFEGNTFVGFMDISGFSQMVKRDEQSALDVLDQFYNSGFKALGKRSNSDPIIKGIFVSDCGVLFARSNSNESDEIKALKKMLIIINTINTQLIKAKIMLTSSIAYGLFKYQKRNIILGKINKQFICGRPYLKAYLDNSNEANPKIRPGECRILIDNLPNDVKSHIDTSITNQSDRFDKPLQDSNHYYYYWMCNSANSIDRYKSKYDSIYNGINLIDNNNETINNEKYKEIALLIESYSSNE